MIASIPLPESASPPLPIPAWDATFGLHDTKSHPDNILHPAPGFSPDTVTVSGLLTLCEEVVKHQELIAVQQRLF